MDVTASSAFDDLIPTGVPVVPVLAPRGASATGSLAAAEVLREIPTFVEGDVEAAELPEDVTPRERSDVAARVANIVIAGLALVLLAPVMALIALAIKLTSRGPVFYLQTRVGLDRRWGQSPTAVTRRRHDYGGKLFTMYKFRTMHVNAEADGKAVWAAQCDPRVTAIGGLLRRTRLDELPQFYNVLRGDMNIVGPRPERPSIFVRLRSDIPQYALRQRVRPGITGWAQVNQSYDSCLADVRRKTRFDIEYLRRQSLAEDLRIMGRTIPVMLFRRGGW